MKKFVKYILVALVITLSLSSVVSATIIDDPYNGKSSVPPQITVSIQP